MSLLFTDQGVLQSSLVRAICYGVHTEPRGAVGKGPADAAAGAEGEGVVGPTPVADEVAVGVAPRA